VEIARGIVRDSEAVERQAAAVAGHRRAHEDVGSVARREELDGMGAVLLWAMGMRTEAPVSLRDVRISKAAAMDEWAHAGSVTLDRGNAARDFAAGAHAALHWLLTASDGDLVRIP
jgi:hypothetical protein